MTTSHDINAMAASLGLPPCTTIPVRDRNSVITVCRKLPSGYWHIHGRGVCNWTQPPHWPCSEELIRQHAFPEADEVFIQAVIDLATETP